MKKITYYFVLCAIVLGFFCQNAFAQQTGTIKGQIIDSTANETIIGATVQIENTTIGAATDVEGNFQITNVQVGTYTVVISMLGYKTKLVAGVVVMAGKATIIQTNLETTDNQLGDIVVTAQRETLTELAVISEIKMSEQVAVGISSEQIQKTQDRDAAQVVKRIAGVSIVDDRFIMIRGLSQRYNTVMLNDAIAPSSEVDIRAFSFDMLPSSAIDRILIYKSGAGELPGEFAGGIVKVYTKLAPTENFTSIGIGTGVRMGTTFNKAPIYKGSGTDFLGFDNGLRSLPANMPSTSDFKKLSAVERANVANKFQNNWALNNDNVSPDLRLNFGLGRRFTVGGVQVGNLTSLAYSQTHQHVKDAIRNRIGTYFPQTDKVMLDFDFKDQTYSRNVRFSAISNWSFVFNRYNKIEFRNFFNQMGNTETIDRTSTDIVNVTDILYKTLRYEQRSIYSTQLSGKHTLNDKGMAIKWLAGFGHTNRKEPDFRRYKLQRPLQGITDNNPYIISVPSTPNDKEASRFFSKLNEYAVTGSVNFELPFDDKGEAENASKFRTGIYTDYKTRKFDSRFFSYVEVPNAPVGQGLSGINTLPAEQLFSPQYVNGTNNLTLSEGTSNDNAYNASNFLFAPYVSQFLSISERFSLSVGARLEYNDQKLFTTKDGKQSQVGGKAIASLLPSINFTFNVNNKSLFRLAYSSSINRPEFRELAPFAYYEPNLEAVQQGNQFMGIARIDNVDLRYEYYPTPTETITFGAFYKYFRNPIENQLLSSSGIDTYKFLQADRATSYGVETEIRKGFANARSKVFQNLTVVLNASYIVSRVTNPETIRIGDVDVSTANALQKTRPMYGQSPYLINAGLYYNDEVSKWQFSLLYNVCGPRIFAVGNLENPSQYEMPRHSLDLTVSKRLKNGIEVKVGAQELLNPSFKILEDTELNGKIQKFERRNPIYSYKRGQYITLALNYKF